MHSAVLGRAGHLRNIAALLALLVALAGCSATTTPREVLDVPAAPQKYAALVVDAASGRTLHQVNATAPRYPASLTKMMTMYMVFEALETGRLSKSTLIPISANAASRPPTKLGVKSGDAIDVDTALKALAVKSANDVATAVGEFLGGSEEGFAAMMTARARQLGMGATRFANASGLPDDAQRTTARDMAVLGMALRSRFGAHYHYFGLREFSFRGKRVRGHNDLLGSVDGVDGIKTGYIRASGYSIVTSIRKNGRSLVIVVMGADSARARNAHVEELIERYLPGASGGGFGLRPLFARQ